MWSLFGKVTFFADSAVKFQTLEGLITDSSIVIMLVSVSNRAFNAAIHDLINALFSAVGFKLTLTSICPPFAESATIIEFVLNPKPIR